ncbi:hypothetical protein BFJ68_g16611 [Fusarium oxysporum]|uniref:Uncharacterized protein n=1 Tax=Fusarium oxysporum TaxID=5507 RepID=A0A420N6B1_FUSOX|nr:hypothetical protein BFJ71_g17051 [Fusarium oxysporum]RKK89877.1 hypothetical protein BFJ68_g16611 [Fusarium oxysporum]
MSLRGFHGVATPLSSVSIAMGNYSHNTTPKLLGSQPSFSRQQSHTLELPSRSAANYNNPRTGAFIALSKRSAWTYPCQAVGRARLVTPIQKDGFFLAPDDGLERRTDLKEGDSYYVSSVDNDNPAGTSTWGSPELGKFHERGEVDTAIDAQP